MTTEDYEIRLATIKDKSQIINLMVNGFYKEEPLIKYMRQKQQFPEHGVWREFSENELLDPSLVVVKHGIIIGVSLNSILEKGQDDSHSHFDVRNIARSQILQFLNGVEKQCNFWSYFPNVSKGITVDRLGVDNAFKGQGIAKKLINRTRELGKQRGCGFMKVIASSHYTARALENLGFQLLHQVNYEDYKVDGETVFKPDPPHEAVKVYVQKL